MKNKDIFIDDADLKILAHVQASGRDGLADIGAVAGLSISAVNERLKRLQSSGVITGWEARIDPHAVGIDVLAYVFVTVGIDVEQPFRTRVLALPEVMECHHMTGEWSYLVKIRVPSLEGLEVFLENAKASRLIGKSHSMIALKTIKESARIRIPSSMDSPPAAPVAPTKSAAKAAAAARKK